MPEKVQTSFDKTKKIQVPFTQNKIYFHEHKINFSVIKRRNKRPLN